MYCPNHTSGSSHRGWRGFKSEAYQEIRNPGCRKNSEDATEANQRGSVEVESASLSGTNGLGYNIPSRPSDASLSCPGEIPFLTGVSHA